MLVASILRGGGMDATARRARVERASPDDLLQLAWDGHPTPWHAGAVLTLESEPVGGVTAVRERFLALTYAVPRLRQRLTPTPPGCGRPVWVDDPAFAIDRHVRLARCPPPGDEASLLDLAAELMGTPLPRSQPPWSATLVTGLDDEGAALVLVFHHVLTDGVGGLAMLAHLVDGAPAAPKPAVHEPPRAGRLAIDAAASRARAVARAPSGLQRLRDGLRELGADRSLRAPRTSLNRPTGPTRRVAVARADLEAIRGQ
jgi:diacylglycerol O-acyltransferase / wax synthase